MDIISGVMVDKDVYNVRNCIFCENNKQFVQKFGFLISQGKTRGWAQHLQYSKKLSERTGAD